MAINPSAPVRACHWRIPELHSPAPPLNVGRAPFCSSAVIKKSWTNATIGILNRPLGYPLAEARRPLIFLLMIIREPNLKFEPDPPESCHFHTRAPIAPIAQQAMQKIPKLGSKISDYRPEMPNEWLGEGVGPPFGTGPIERFRWQITK